MLVPRPRFGNDSVLSIDAEVRQGGPYWVREGQGSRQRVSAERALLERRHPVQE